MSLPCDRRAAFRFIYSDRKPTIHERRWLAGQSDFPAMPQELRALTALLSWHRCESLAADRVARGEEAPVQAVPTDAAPAARRRGRFA